MMQNLKVRGTWAQDSQRKFAFLRNRKVSTLNRSHRLSQVAQVQFRDREEALKKSGLPKF